MESKNMNEKLRDNCSIFHIIFKKSDFSKVFKGAYVHKHTDY